MGKANKGITPVEMELAFLIFSFNPSVKAGIITTPPPSPDNEDTMPVKDPMI